MNRGVLLLLFFFGFLGVAKHSGASFEFSSALMSFQVGYVCSSVADADILWRPRMGNSGAAAS